MTAPTLALCACLALLPPDPPRDPWFAEDKVKHFFASFVVTSLAASGARSVGLDARASVWAGAGLGTAVGVWKEIRDQGRQGETASFRDLAWDLMGVGAASAVMDQVR